LVALLGLSALPVVAAGTPPPIHDVFQDERSFIDDDTCSFDVAVHLTATIDDLLVFDASGNLVRVRETVRHVSIEFNANGKTLSATGTGGIDLRFAADGSVAASTFGIDILLVIPGQGPIYLDAGHAVFLFDPHIHVLFEAGPASYDTGAFCTALA
jgi:hypothetical protein